MRLSHLRLKIIIYSNLCKHSVYIHSKVGNTVHSLQAKNNGVIEIHINITV